MPSKNSNLRVPYARTVYGKEEVNAVLRVLSDPGKIVSGPYVRDFEVAVAKLFGKKYGVMTNSGSAANLLALEVLDLPPGSEIITPALTFATTVAPILQKGLKPVFVDVEPKKYNIDAKQIERRITRKTKAIMVPSLVGNFPDLARLSRIAKKHKLRFIEDSCDTIGGSFHGKPSGYFSDISTISFYASHIVTAAGGGGAVCFHDPKLAQKAKIMANWGRQSTLFGFYEKSEEIKRRFTSTLHGKPYDAKFLFTEVGYNFQPLELSAAFGLEQLKRLRKFVDIRRRNFNENLKFFRAYERFFTLPEEHPNAKVVWLAFPLIVKKTAPFTRHEITKYLEEQNIQTRPVMTGNILRQPGFEKALKGENPKAYPGADQVMEQAFLIGCHQGLTSQHLTRVRTVFREFLSRYR
jgi:CDP-6-deoxy-D-xylo-4-hexulose-3-dehydrase